MPRAARRACQHQPCKNDEPCADHPRAVRQVRPGTGREYKGSWLHERAVALREVPYCPGYGKWKGKCGARTTQVDHKKPLRDGGSRARANLQPYCGRCHRSKTATEDGALGNRRRRPGAEVKR